MSSTSESYDSLFHLEFVLTATRTSSKNEIMVAPRAKAEECMNGGSAEAVMSEG